MLARHATAARRVVVATRLDRREGLGERARLAVPDELAHGLEDRLLLERHVIPHRLPQRRDDLVPAIVFAGRLVELGEQPAHLGVVGPRALGERARPVLARERVVDDRLLGPCVALEQVVELREQLLSPCDILLSRQRVEPPEHLAVLLADHFVEGRLVGHAPVHDTSADARPMRRAAGHGGETASSSGRGPRSRVVDRSPSSPCSGLASPPALGPLSRPHGPRKSAGREA
nr:hypothetical protein [Nannocystis exedens]